MPVAAELEARMQEMKQEENGEGKRGREGLSEGLEHSRLLIPSQAAEIEELFILQAVEKPLRTGPGPLPAPAGSEEGGMTWFGVQTPIPRAQSGIKPPREGLIPPRSPERDETPVARADPTQEPRLG